MIEDSSTLKNLVQEYVGRIESVKDEQQPDYGTVREVFSEINAAVLRMYDLPHALELELLLFLRDYPPKVPFADANPFGAIADQLTALSKSPSDDESEQRETWRFLEKALVNS
jgi:hypothetical protein